MRLPQADPQEERRVFYFGPFALDAAQHRLLRRGATLHVTSRALHLLLFLVRNAGVTLTVDEILSAVWNDKNEATDATLRQHVLMLRHALEENEPERYIATDYGRGYRFLGEVTERPPSFMTSVVEQYCAAAAEFQSSGSPAALMAALHLYERALSIDHSSAPALGGAALTRILMADAQYDRPKKLLESAEPQSEAALLADPQSIDALMALCKVRLDYYWSFPDALALAQRAFSIDPTHRIVAFMNGWILSLSGRFSDSLAFLDSLPPQVLSINIIQTCRGITTLFSGDYAAARTELQSTCSRWPEYWFSRAFLGLALLVLGEEDEALKHFDAVRLSAYDPLMDRQMNARYFAEGYALYTRFRIGDTANAEAALQRLKRVADSQFVPAMCLALAEIGRKNHDAALQYIYKCRDNRECWYTHLGVDPLVKELGLRATELYRQQR